MQLKIYRFYPSIYLYSSQLIRHVSVLFDIFSVWILVFIRTDRKDDTSNPSRDVNAGMYDGFSETQTESQVLSLYLLPLVSALSHVLIS